MKEPDGRAKGNMMFPEKQRQETADSLAGRTTATDPSAATKGSAASGRGIGHRALELLKLADVDADHRVAEVLDELRRIRC